jgi:hypothetical protein
MLKSVHTLTHLRKLYRHVSKLDQLISIQYMAINYYKQSVPNTKNMHLDRQGQTTICHSSEDQLLYQMDKEAEYIL